MCEKNFLTKEDSVKNIFFINDFVGKEILRWLIDTYPNDLKQVIVLQKGIVADFIERYNLQSRFNILFYKDELSILKSFKPKEFSCGFLLWWPNIISQNIINLSKNGFVNTHPSLLPYGRGKYPNFWAIVENNPYGVTLHLVDEKIDNGDILFQQEIAKSWEDSGESLYRKALVEMVNLFKEKYHLLRTGTFTKYVKAKDELVAIDNLHYASDLNSIIEIDVDNIMKVKDIFNLLRAKKFTGHQNCFFYDNNKKYEVSINIKEIVNES